MSMQFPANRPGWHQRIEGEAPKRTATRRSKSKSRTKKSRPKRSHPNPAYLLGAMLDDGVAVGKAVEIARQYAADRERLDGPKTWRWLNRLLTHLGAASDHPNTTFAVLCQPSDHIAPHYRQLARDAGWKEN